MNSATVLAANDGCTTITWGASNPCDRRYIADEIEIEVVIERRVDGVRRTRQQKRIAVRAGTRDRFGGEIAAGTRPGLDDELLTKSLRQPLRHQTREDVICATGCESDHDPHRPRGISLRVSKTGCGWQRSRTRG